MSPKFKIEFDCGNDAFADNLDREIVNMLNDVAAKIYLRGVDSVTAVLDSNGNKIGTVSFQD